MNDNMKVIYKDININIEKDDWNTKHFGMKMGNIEVRSSQTLNEKEFFDAMKNVLKEAQHREFKHLTFKMDTNDKKYIATLESCGFHLRDTLISYIFSYKKAILPKMHHRCKLGICQSMDIETLKKLSKKAFKIDRYHSDPSLDNELCDSYYENWISNSYYGLADRIITAYVNDTPVGYTTAKLPNYNDNKIAHLVLSAVGEEARGKGVYTSMIFEGVKWLENKADYVMVGTQINNIAVQKAWINLGFTVHSSAYIYQLSID